MLSVTLSISLSLSSLWSLVRSKKPVNTAPMALAAILEATRKTPSLSSLQSVPSAAAQLRRVIAAYVAAPAFAAFPKLTLHPLSSFFLSLSLLLGVVAGSGIFSSSAPDTSAFIGVAPHFSIASSSSVC